MTRPTVNRRDTMCHSHKWTHTMIRCFEPKGHASRSSTMHREDLLFRSKCNEIVGHNPTRRVHMPVKKEYPYWAYGVMYVVSTGDRDNQLRRECRAVVWPLNTYLLRIVLSNRAIRDLSPLETDLQRLHDHRHQSLRHWPLWM